jgi:hypothetical protein
LDIGLEGLDFVYEFREYGREETQTMRSVWKV